MKVDDAELGLDLYGSPGVLGFRLLSHLLHYGFVECLCDQSHTVIVFREFWGHRWERQTT